MGKAKFLNPFRPGAGHPPPYLAGRGKETHDFRKLLDQEVILQNVVLTGLRGVGKTVLLDARLKPLAIKSGWYWVGTDLGESASLSEGHIAMRLLTDLAVATSHVVIGQKESSAIGFARQVEPIHLDFRTLWHVFNHTNGLTSDKIRAVLEFVWECIKDSGKKGIIFAYDEAQNMTDHAAKDEYPLSLMLDCFQSIQKKGIPFMLVMTGLPTLFPKLIEARTFSERMFHVLTLDRLDEEECREAITKPIEAQNCPVKLTDDAVETFTTETGGYPYFVQFVCKEAYDSYLQQQEAGIEAPKVLISDVMRKLDSDFFAGRWSKATDRQRELLMVVAQLDGCSKEFTLQEVSAKSAEVLEKPFSTSHISQMFGKLAEIGLIYKNRYGKYAFAVPLMHEFIKRQEG